jgi:pyruvate dehydrogenase E2 component (dihydrolipoamide acetyltransferase)
LRQARPPTRPISIAVAGETAASIALAIIILPVIARATEEVLLLVPSTLREGSMALGATRARTVVSVILPSAFGGIVTATIVGVARAATPRISPKARRLAQEKGVDVSRLTGSGPGGEILADDIIAAVRESESGDRATQPLESDRHRTATPSIGRLMAERTTQSWTTVPHFFVTREIDAGALNEARERMLQAVERSHGAKVTHTDLLVALVARTLTRHPRLNASWERGEVITHQEVNVALAIGVENAVVTAVIPGADRAAAGDIAVRRRELTERAQAGRLQPADITGATFTISNLGMFGVDAFTAIIVPPQAAILAVGAIADRVVAVNGQPAVRPMMSMTLSCDHRVASGVQAAEFMRDLANAITSPQL